MKKIFVTLLILVFSTAVLALENLNFKGGYISDNANIITRNDYSAIESIIRELKSETTAEIAVVTVNSLQGQNIEDVAVQIGRTYKVGAKNINNGIVLLVAPNERTARIEVGMGLENTITNNKADNIMNDDMIPYFAQNEYSKGIYRGVASLADIIANSYNKTLTYTSNAPEKKTYENNRAPWWVYPLAFFAIIFGGRRRRRGAFGGGGGFSGGHGSTGRW